jgi:DNA-binding transcriptional MerR regulator
MAKKSFTAGDVRGILGIPQRTLDYWDERDIVRPTVKRASGKGTEREYSYSDLVDLSVVLRLRATGLSLQRIRKGLRYLRQFKRQPIRNEVFVTDGDDLFIKKKDNQLVSVLRGGQMAFSVVFLGRIPVELKPAIKKLELEEKEKAEQRKKRAKSA